MLNKLNLKRNRIRQCNIEMPGESLTREVKSFGLFGISKILKTEILYVSFHIIGGDFFFHNDHASNESRLLIGEASL